jgi:hypothetical protein
MIAVLFLVAAAVAAAALWGIWMSVQRAVDKHGIHVLAWRFATGADMANGRSHACAPGVTCPAGRWSHMRRHHRAGVRWTMSGFLLGCAFGVLADPGALAAGLIAAVVAGIAAVVLWARQTRARRQHDRVIVRPLAASLASTIAVSEAEAARMVQLPAAAVRRNRGEIGSIALPRSFAASPDQRKAVDHLVTSHLPVEVETRWQVAGAPKRLVILAAPSPPDSVPFESVRPVIEQLKPGQVLLGLDRRHESYLGDFNGGDDPHWGFSVGSGRGKSTQLCSIGAQVLHQDPGPAAVQAARSVGQYPGPTMLGIDPKMTSFEALAGVPGVELANDPRDMTGGGGVVMAEYPDIPRLWKAIRGYRAMMDNRISAKHADPTLEFPVSLLFLDELNMFSAMSAGWWKAQGQKGTPDIWMDIAAVFWMGRFVHCHAVAVGQRLDDKATGGIGLRDSLGLRGLAGFRPNQWKMLIGTTPVPKSQKPRGRWIYSDGQDETWVQNVYMTPAEARSWAMPTRAPEAAGVSGAAVRLVPPARTGDASPDGRAAVSGTVWIVGLQAAANYLDMSPAAFEKARQRRPVDGEIRRGNQPSWSADDLNEWAASRPRAGTAQESVQL